MASFRKKKYLNEAEEVARGLGTMNFLGGFIEGISIVNFCGRFLHYCFWLRGKLVEY